MRASPTIGSMIQPAAQPPEPLCLTFAAQLSPSDAGSATPDTVVRFAGVAYSGGIVPHYGWNGDVAIDLSELQNPNGDQLPVLVDHCASIDAIAGLGRISRVLGQAGAELHIEGALTSATESGQLIAKLMREGYPLQLSVGLHAELREIAPGAGPILINGQALAVAAVFERPLIREVSFVAIGADPDTTASQLSATLAQPPTLKGTLQMSRTPEDQTLIETLQADTERLQTELADMKKRHADAATAQRQADIAALFTDLGREAPANIDPYLNMSADSFAVYASDLRAANKTARKADSALFGSQAQSRAASIPEPHSAGKSLFAAVTKLSAPQRQHA